MRFHKISTIHDGCVAEMSTIPALFLYVIMIQYDFYFFNFFCRPIMRPMIGNADVAIRMRFHIIQLNLQLMWIMPIVIIIAIADILTAASLHARCPIGTSMMLYCFGQSVPNRAPTPPDITRMTLCTYSFFISILNFNYPSSTLLQSSFSPPVDQSSFDEQNSLMVCSI